ncbi:MAG: sulfur relay protein DsrC [Chromatiales bacterium]|nr:sulfur relay protein DsrC [Gammaproteobacteria bacterium]MCP5230637.1 sulfur relay protein DsrC [Zoogloeaceae bacterium]MCP5352898.1 sulfur relay protein DsrC [Chromatiales bacterium]
MLWLSEVLIQHHELQSFDGLCEVIKDRAHNGELFFRMDVKPPFTDTPDDWEDRLEAAFTSALR